MAACQRGSWQAIVIIGAGKEQNVAGAACIGCVRRREDLRPVGGQVLGFNRDCLCSAAGALDCSEGRRFADSHACHCSCLWHHCTLSSDISPVRLFAGGCLCNSCRSNGFWYGGYSSTGFALCTAVNTHHGRSPLTEAPLLLLQWLASARSVALTPTPLVRNLKQPNQETSR